MDTWLPNDSVQARQLIAVLGVLLVVPLLAFSIYLWRVSGEHPQRRILRALSVALVTGAAGLAIALWRLALLIR